MIYEHFCHSSDINNIKRFKVANAVFHYDIKISCHSKFLLIILPRNKEFLPNPIQMHEIQQLTEASESVAAM